MVYIIALIGALIGAWVNNRMSPTIRKSYFLILCLYMIFLMGFRYKVGIDTISYMHAFQRIPSLDNMFSSNIFIKSRFEPGFLIICCICKSFSSEFWPVQMVMATITTGCVFIFLHRYCKNVFIGIVLYIILQWFYFTAEIMRESAAVGIFLLNYKNLEEKRWSHYYFFSIFSVLFHYSAIIIWFFPFVKLLNLNLYFYIMCGCFLAITPLVESLNEYIQIATIAKRINQYVSGAEDLNFNWRIGELIKSAFPAIITIIIYSIYKLKSEFRHFLLLQILFCMGAFAIPLIFSRFTNYTTLFVTASAANLLSVYKIKKWVKAAFIAIIILTQSYSFYSSYNRWFPYVSVFYPEELPMRNQLYRHFFMPWLRYIKN